MNKEKLPDWPEDLLVEKIADDFDKMMRKCQEWNPEVDPEKSKWAMIQLMRATCRRVDRNLETAIRYKIDHFNNH